MALLVAVFLAVGSTAQAAPLLKGREARHYLVRWSIHHNMVEAKVGRCLRKSPSHLRCEMTETGWWGHLSEHVWAEGVDSWYAIRQGADSLLIRWIGFVWVDECSREPGIVSPPPCSAP